ncbi:hypothetical protein CONPUDRAFT_72202 [Coniophora puteana RWD-64-598 SS2]|uniref:Protein kinase domain-containing protein n=1 Tax=Coniophora puteana (strain RWD-64-598) TaxID=741705 RepID=A0A5M3MRV2_CONPW|nr:uncharacterized protein CONPUDRAFT_72202 [Coniophora puteana RWD-64-598 SS2]EIW81816.1 hypothetical protein CONPUDRAFT_72202 [Coniophora puteana RWD-64-598 SS2]
MIKLYAFELDNVLWSGVLDATRYGKGRGASKVPEDNLQLRLGDEGIVEDRSVPSNPENFVILFPEVTRVFHDIAKNNLQIAIVSNNGGKKLCDRALWLFRAPDKNASRQSLTTFVRYDENDVVSKVEMFKNLKTWSGVDFVDMVFFDLDCAESQQVQQHLGVHVKTIDKRDGLTWTDYVDASQGLAGGQPPHKQPNGTPGGHIPRRDDPRQDKPPQELPPFYDMPALGRTLGSGAFSDVYMSKSDPEIIVKKLKHWRPGIQQRFVAIYKVVEAGRPFTPDPSRDTKDEEYLSQIALELRNLRAVGELKGPADPERFCGWFSMKFVRGNPIWDNATYWRHPFGVPFQTLLKRAFHLTVDEIEYFVKKHGMEHRDAHLANVKFETKGGTLVRAHVFDWGFAARMTWDGRYYVRANDTLVWNSGEAGAKYTPDQFRKYWIEWMVKTEYEAQMSRQGISREDGSKFLANLDWWFEWDK